MTDQKPEALRLAECMDLLDTFSSDTPGICSDAAAELRRLHEVNAAQEALVEELFSRIATQETVMQQVREALEKFGRGESSGIAVTALVIALRECLEGKQ